MLLCLDVGNTQIYGGFFENKKIRYTFRIQSKSGWSSDQLGTFFRSFCREHEINLEQKIDVVISSVVPSLDYHLKNACLKYFKSDPLFVRPGIKTGLIVNKFPASSEIGADIISTAVAGIFDFPDQNIIIVDLGTANTMVAVNKKKEFLTGVIFPGMKTQVDSLASSAEKLSQVEIIRSQSTMTKNTIDAIQTGIYYSTLGGLRLLLKNMGDEAFNGEPFTVLGTGGFSRVFQDEKLFDFTVPDLVLNGLVHIHRLNS